MVDISTVGIVPGAKKRVRRSEYLAESFPNTASFGIGTFSPSYTVPKVYRAYWLREVPYRSHPYGSVWPKYPTEHFGKGRYGLDTGSRHFGKFGTTSKGNIRGSGVLTEHTLDIR